MKRIRVLPSPLAPKALWGEEGVVIEDDMDDDIREVERDDGSVFFVPVDAVEEL